jgi:hypothetical protein
VQSDEGEVPRLQLSCAPLRTRMGKSSISHVSVGDGYQSSRTSLRPDADREVEWARVVDASPPKTNGGRAGATFRPTARARSRKVLMKPISRREVTAV